MKKILKTLYICILLVFILFGIKVPIIFGAGRFVDIPVPPNSSGYTDFSPEDGENQEKQYEQQQKKFENTANALVEKSSNNYLRKLEIKGYQIEPAFNKETNEYVLDINNDGNVTEINISAEAEEPEKTRIEGDGIINIIEGQNIVNINVIAENGNLNVYTINIKNNYKPKAKIQIEQNSLEDKNESIETITETNTTKENIDWKKILFSVICIIFLFIILILKINKPKSHNRRNDL